MLSTLSNTMGKSITEDSTEGLIKCRQALCLAVKTALTSVDINHTHHIIIWHRPRTLPEKILMLKPHRDNHITYDTQSLMSEYLCNHNSLTITFCYFHRAWLGTLY